MNILEAIPIPVDAKSYVVGLLPIIALALGICINAFVNRGHNHQ